MKIQEFLSSTTDINFLASTNISYIYLTKPYPYLDLEDRLIKTGFRKVFENEKIIIFRKT